MVNTRRSSQAPAPATDEHISQAGEQSDSSVTSVTTRRSTRRSVGSVLAPTEVVTPTRRSRRLSNSSVESVNNDTPRPATRRSTRNKTTGGSDSETNEVELVVIKRRKVVGGLDTLVPISEEKNEIERFNKDKEDVKTDNSLVRIDVVTSPVKATIASPLKSESATSPVKTTFASPAKTSPGVTSPVKPSATTASPAKTVFTTSPVKPAATTISPVKPASITSPVSTANGESLSVQPEENISLIKGVKTLVSEEKNDTKEHSYQDYKDIETTDSSTELNKAISPLKAHKGTCPLKTATTIASPAKSDCITSPIKTINEIDIPVESVGTISPVETADEIPSPVKITTEANSPVKSKNKPALLFGIPSNLIRVNNSLNGKKAKTAHKKRKVQNKVEPQKPTLPCGADIMRNIPRGKCKSGREWKAPKSNPRYLYKDKGLKMPFEKITQLRLERKRVKDLENRMKEEERARRAEITRRRQINKQREEENARRGEVVQVIRNTNKIKRMKKKQLKLIQKRDTTKIE